MKKITLLLVMLLLAVGGVKADVEWTIFSGSMAAGNFDTALYADATWCKALEAGDQLVGTATINTGKESDYSIQLYYGWDLISNFTYSEGTISYTLTADDITKLQTTDKGMRVRGKNITLTSLKVKKTKSAIKTTISATGSTDEWGSNVSFPKNSLTNAVEGDYVLVCLSSSASDSQGKVGMSSNGTDTYGFNEYVQAFAGIVTSDMAGESTKNGYVQGKNITVSGAALYHPLSSFSIGSIGYATFSASQQVQAPEGVMAYQATISGSKVILHELTDRIIPANTGVIIAGDEGAILEFVANSSSADDVSSNVLQPVVDAALNMATVTSEDSENDYYVLYAGNSASETDYAIGTWGWFNKDTDPVSWDPITKTLTYTGSYGYNIGYWMGSVSSDYNYLKLNFTSNTLNADATISITYSDATSTTSQTLSAGSTSSISIPVNSSSVNNLQFNTSATSGSLTFGDAAWVDEDGGPKVAEFRKTESGTLALNKAYLKISKGSLARTLNISFGENDGTTGISEMPVAQKKVENNIYYNLQGQRVSNLGKGLFIVNGKKVIIK